MFYIERFLISRVFSTDVLLNTLEHQKYHRLASKRLKYTLPSQISGISNNIAHAFIVRVMHKCQCKISRRTESCQFCNNTVTNELSGGHSQCLPHCPWLLYLHPYHLDQVHLGDPTHTHTQTNTKMHKNILTNTHTHTQYQSDGWEF